MAELIKEENAQIYQNTLEDMARREMASSENLDRAILFTSLPTLGLVFTFFHSNDGIVWPVVFYMSSIFLLLAVFAVVISYKFCIKSRYILQEGLEDYFLRGGEKPQTVYTKLIDLANGIAFYCYLLGMFFIVVFICFNL